MSNAPKHTVLNWVLHIGVLLGLFSSFALTAQEIQTPAPLGKQEVVRRLSAEEITAKIAGQSLKGHHAKSNTNPTFTFHSDGNFSNDYGQTGKWKVVQGKTAGVLILDVKAWGPPTEVHVRLDSTTGKITIGGFWQEL